MTPDLWKQVQTIIDDVLDLPVDLREARIKDACAGDASLEKEVRSLLQADSKANNLFDNIDIPDDIDTTLTVSMKTFEHYRLVEKIGVGGMGIVYKAIDSRLGRTVALKFLSPQLNEDEQGRSRFYAEAKAVSQLDHPNVCLILDIGETPDKQLYFSMPFYEGRTLKERLKEDPPTIQEAVNLITQMCHGIAAAHESTIIHRDIKPANILVASDGIVKVLDFGVAKVAGTDMTMTGQAIGTMAYMSPEQLQGEKVDHKSDIWSIGVLFYELLTMRRPFRGKSNLIISNAILACDPAPISKYFFDIPPLLEQIIAKTICKNPDDRYNTVRELIGDLEQLQNIDASKSPIGQLAPTAALEKSDHSLSSLSTPAASGDTMGTITRQFAQHVGPSARLLVNTLSQHTDTIDDLCIRLADEIPDQSQRITFLNSVSHLTLASRSDISVSSQHNTTGATSGALTSGALNSRLHDKRLWAGGIIGLLLLVIGMVTIPQWRYAVTDSVDAIAEPVAITRGITSSTLTLGMSAPFSGSTKELGRAMQMGMEARFNEINEAGGIHGRTIKLSALDDSNNPDNAALNLDTLLDPEQGAFALIGNVGTPTTEAILPRVLEAKTLLFGSLSGAKTLRENPPARFIFNYRASYREETAALVNYFVTIEAVDANKFAVFYQNDSYGLDGLSGVQAALRQHGVEEPVISASFERNTAQVEEGATTIIAARGKIEAIIVISTYQASALFTKALRDGGYTGKIANVSFVGSKELAEQLTELGPDYVDGIVISQVVPYYDSYATGVINYRDALKKYYPNELPGFTSLEGYITASIFAEALQRSGRQLSTDSMIDALEAIDNLDLGIGQNISFSQSNHQASRYIWGTRLNAQGTFENIELMPPPQVEQPVQTQP